MATRFTMCTLFDQLGMPSSTKDIEAFFDQHHLRADVPLLEAPFWNTAQQQFLQDVLLHKTQQTPAEWQELVSELYARLRH